MRGLAATGGDLFDTLGRGVRWWVGELAALVPARLAGRGRRAAAVLEVGTAAATLVLGGRGGAPATRVPLDGADPALDRARVQAALRRRGGRSVVVRLDPSLVLDASVTLPLAAERSLRPILVNQLDRLVPLPPDEIAFEYVVTGRAAAARTIDVTVVVATRAAIDRAVARARALGLVPRTLVADVPIAGRDRPAVLWRADSEAPATPMQRRLRRALEAATVLLLVAAYGLYVHRLGVERDRLERQVAVAARQAAGARGIADANARIERALALVERRQREMEPLMLLDELTRLVPDTMWVSQLTVRGRSIEMIGYSPRVSDLITRIENHEIFYNPEFRSPITRSTAGEGERFDLAFDVWVEDPP